MIFTHIHLLKAMKYLWLLTGLLGYACSQRSFRGGYGGGFGGRGGSRGSFGGRGGGGMNFGQGYPVVNPYFPGLGGGLDIFNGLNPNTEPTSPYTKQASTNCRMVEVKSLEGRDIDNFEKCVEIKMMAYNWIIEDMEPQGGACRWQGGVKGVGDSDDQRGVCLCPATTEKLCTKDRSSCFFHTDRKSKESTCISKPERFYNQLARLLSKRGKKDFSMKIQYGGSGARGYLPMGLQGPSLIGRGNPYLGHHNRMHYGNFGPQGTGAFGFSPNYQYRTGQGFGGFGGHGPQGNYSNQFPGAAAWGNPASPFAPPFSPAMGYGIFRPQFPSPIAPPQYQPHGAGQQAYGSQPPQYGALPLQYGAQQPQYGAGVGQGAQGQYQPGSGAPLFSQNQRPFGQYAGMQQPPYQPPSYGPGQGPMSPQQQQQATEVPLQSSTTQ